MVSFHYWYIKDFANARTEYFYPLQPRVLRALRSPYPFVVGIIFVDRDWCTGMFKCGYFDVGTSPCPGVTQGVLDVTLTTLSHKRSPESFEDGGPEVRVKST